MSDGPGCFIENSDLWEVGKKTRIEECIKSKKHELKYNELSHIKSQEDIREEIFKLEQRLKELK